MYSINNSSPTLFIPINISVPNIQQFYHMFIPINISVQTLVISHFTLKTMVIHIKHNIKNYADVPRRCSALLRTAASPNSHPPRRRGARNMPCKLGAASKKAPYRESAAPSRRSKTPTSKTTAVAVVTGHCQKNIKKPKVFRLMNLL